MQWAVPPPARLPPPAAPIVLAGATSYPESFNQDRLAGRGGWYDVVVITCGEAFNAHAMVLATASTQLAARLKDAAPLPKQRRVLLELHDEVVPETFELVLDFLYTGRVECSNEVQLPALLDAALRLQLPGLQAAVVAALEQHLTASTCIAAWEVAERGQHHDLEVAARDVVFKELARISGLDSAQLEALPPERVRAMLADARLGAGKNRVFAGLVQVMGEQMGEGRQAGASTPPQPASAEHDRNKGRWPRAADKQWVTATRAKADAADRVQAESATLARAEAAGREKADAVARGQADARARVRAEAKARAEAESASRLKAVSGHDAPRATTALPHRPPWHPRADRWFPRACRRRRHGRRRRRRPS